MLSLLVLATAGWLGARVPASAQSYAYSTLAGRAGVIGGGDGTNANAQFNYPQGIAVDTVGNVYVADADNFLIRKIRWVGSNRVVTTVAGSAGAEGSADGTNKTARFSFPAAVTADIAGNLFVADTGNHTIRKIVPVGTNWVVSTLAGLAGNPGSADGTNQSARFSSPSGIAVDSAGSVYVADYGNYTIRKLSADGTNWVAATIAGQAGAPGSANGTNNSARFNHPNGLAVDGASRIYVADDANCAIRMLTANGTNWVVTTLAGGSLGSADGTNAGAKFYYPLGVAVDAATNVFVADTRNDTIRKLTASGTNWVVTTVGGRAGAAASADGVGRNARFAFPNGVAVDAAGNLHVADTWNNIIRLGKPGFELHIAPSGSQVQISWPILATNFLLETRGRVGLGGTWRTLSNGFATNLTSYVLTTNTAAGAAFYRLRKP